MRKLKLLIAVAALAMGGVCTANAQPTASTPAEGNVYYLYNATTQTFLSLDGNTPYALTTGKAWKLESSDKDGYNKLRVNNDETGYFWGKYWAGYAGSYASYLNETYFKLIEATNGYKLYAGAWDGTDNAYVYINSGSSNRVACNSQEQSGLDEGYYIWQFVAEADYISYMSQKYSVGDDVTAFINNWDFLNCENSNFPGWNISAPNGGNTWKNGDTRVEYWIGSAVNGSFDYYQTITGLPEGRYSISASMWNSTNNEGNNAAVNGNAGVYGTSNNITAFAGVTVDGDALNTYSTELFVNNGEMRVGVKNNGTMGARWFGVDWIKLNYLGKVVQDYALTLPEGGTMEANTWYYFDITAAADNYLATATTLTDIICLTDGNSLTTTTEGTKTLAAENNNFSVGRYYVKSLSANSLSISVAAYTYTIGTATADKAYVQSGNTVTVSFADLSTNDPNGSAIFDFSGVTFGGSALTVTQTDNGFTFTVPSVTASTAYTLSIPAGAVKYNDANQNAAQSITLTTPAIFDGIYYMYNTDTKTYISRSGSYATQAILDNYGLAFIVSTDANNATTLQYFDSYLWLGDDGFCYGDCSSTRVRSFNVSKVEGGYKLLNTNISKYLAVYEGQAVGDAVEGENLQGTSNIWNFESTTDHKAVYTANADAQAAAATANITELSSITTKAALDEELASNYGTTSITITGSKAEKYQQYAGNSQALSENTYYSETVTGLKPGLYKLSVDAFQRAASNAKVAAADGARSLIYLYAGSAKTQLKSIMEYGASTAYANDYEYNGKHYPNNEASAYTALETGEYTNDVYVYVAADENSETGSLEVGIKNPTRLGGDFATWAVYNNWTLTYFEAKATTAEKEALANAISTAEAKTLGFEADEYAPYNNVAAIEALAAAKAIDAETASSADVVAATTALAGATWTANTAEVNAIYWKTDYTANDKASDGYVHPIGWTNTGYNTRIMCAANDASQNTAMTTIGTAVFSKYNTTYGETTGYTMPLKANKIYKITFKYCGWGNNPTTNVVLTDPDNNAITLAPGFHPETNDGNTNADHWYDYTGYFVSTNAGNYVLAMNKVDEGQQQIAWADMQLLSATEIEFADGSVPTYAPGTYPSVKITRTLTANRWATAIYPFAVSGVDNIAVLSNYTASTGELAFDTATSSTANVPFLMRSTAGATEISLSNVEVAAAAAQNAVASEVKLIGVYAATDITKAEKNYVLSNNKIYPVGDAGATINPYRAYIQVDQPTTGGGARSLLFVVDGVTTAIEGISNEAMENGNVYNLQGQRVQNAQKGLFIQNGKKVVLK